MWQNYSPTVLSPRVKMTDEWMIIFIHFTVSNCSEWIWFGGLRISSVVMWWLHRVSIFSSSSSDLQPSGNQHIQIWNYGPQSGKGGIPISLRWGVTASSRVVSPIHSASLFHLCYGFYTHSKWKWKAVWMAQLVEQHNMWSRSSTILEGGHKGITVSPSDWQWGMTRLCQRA